MRDDGFGELRVALFERGFSASYARRLETELREHRSDLEAERLAVGDTPAEASRSAQRSLGADAAIVDQVLARPELRGPWAGMRAALRPLQYAFASADAQWPDGAVAGAAIARWSASISLGTVMTFAMLFALAQTIATGA